MSKKTGISMRSNRTRLNRTLDSVNDKAKRHVEPIPEERHDMENDDKIKVEEGNENGV